MQAKLNKYLAFVESGEIIDSYPAARNRPVTIKIAFKFEPDEQARQFLSRAKEVVESAGFTLVPQVFDEKTGDRRDVLL